MVFRSLVRNWLQTTARDRIHEAVSEEARRRFSERPEQSEAPDEDDDVRCDVGLVFALGIESGCLEDLLENVVSVRGNGFTAKRGTYRGRRVVLILSGSGAEAAAGATEALIEGHRPEWIIAAGFAGGLQPELQRHHMLMADGLLDRSGNRLAVDLKVDPEALRQTPGLHVGPLLSAVEVVREPEQKAALGREHGALAVDLESFAVGEVCSRRAARLLAVRVVSDPVDERMPDDVQKLSQPKTELRRWGAAVGTVWRRPSSFKDMMQLKENALVSSERLAKFLAGIIEQLAPAAEEEPEGGAT
jgi:adenosylhomocysteine nucleosidase